MAETKTYTHQDIQRYLQHKMLPQEMHDFEQALMNDPFLADALDGFSVSDDVLAKAHLAEIEKKIAGEKGTAKVVAMPLQKTAWWRVASIIAVVVAGGLLTYSLVNNTNKNIALQQFPKAFEEVAIEKDSISPAAKPLSKAEAVTKEIPDRKYARSAPEEKERVLKPAAPVTLSANDSSSSAISNSVAPIERNADTESTTAADHVIPSYSAKKMKSAEPALQNEVKGKVTAEKGLQSPPLTEVIVTHIGRKRKAHLVGDSANSAEPKGGWNNFNQYLSQQIDSLKANEEDFRYNDDVVLEFLIDNRGRPTDIKVIEQSNRTVANKAVEILSNGPKWKNSKKEKKVKVVIPF